MAFFHQLRLLLWKNGLNAVRQPLWSLTLISWPLLIFIILAVTRTQFPASVRDTCYVGPRNLPSTGFFPFLQTLMCNSDSICHGKSLESSSKSTPRKTSRSQSSGSPLAKLFGSDDFLKMSFPKDSYKEAAAIIDGVKNLIGASQQRRADGMSVMRGDNSTGGQYDRKAMVESVNRVKRVACTAALHAMNMTSPNRFTQGVVQYCTSNTTLLEAVIKALNRMLTEETMTNPEEMVMVAGAALSILSELQNHTALWEGLLSISRLADKPSAEEALHNLGLLSVTLQSALHVIEDNIPGSAETLSVLHPFLTVAINVINYTENWPGRGLKVKLADVVSDDSTWSDMVKMVLKCGEIPLDKAIFLALDKKLACSYLCNNTDFMGSTLCKLGAVDMAMDLISTEKLVKQILHLWSKHVASRDVAFIRGQLHSLMGGDSPGGKGGANRVRRSLETQPQSVDQELFLDVGKVVLDVMDMLPPLNMIAKNVLRLGYLSMNSVTFGLDLLQDMLQGRWKDAGGMEINTIDEVIQLLMKVLMGKPVTCEDAVAAFEGFVTTDNATMEFTRRLICQDTSELLDYLPRDWHHFLAMIRNLTLEEEDESVPLPMILSAWQKLDVTAAETGMFLSTLLSGNFSLSSGLDAAVSENLQHSLLAILVSSGKNLEKSDLWPVVRNYVFMTDWVLKYQPGETMQRPNCSLDPEMVVHCGGDLNWQTFNGRFLQTLMSPCPATLLSLLKGTVALLEHVYGGTLRQLAASSLQQISTADATDLIQTLRNYLSRVINDSNQNTVDPQVMLNVTKQLFQSIGLTPFVPLLTGESPPSFSDLLGATTQFGRLNKHVLNLNGMDPIMPELERIMMMFLSTEGNLTMSIPHMLGTSLLIYSFDLNPSEVARLRQAVQPFTYQGHILEVVLRAVESMKAVIDSEEGGPDRVVLHYVRQLQEFAMSLSRLRRIEKDPHGQTSQTDLAPLVNNISDYLSPTGIQMLTEAGPEAAQKMILDLFLKMLPVMLQERIPPIIRDFTELQYQLSSCDDVTNCSAGVMRIFTSLEATLKKILSSTADITVEITSPDLLSEGFRDMAECVFSLHLVPEDLISVGTFKKALEVLKMINATSSMSMSEIQHVLQQFNLTMDELEYLTSFLGEVNVNDIMENAMKVPNLLKCFESEQPNEIRNCVVGMMKPLSAFLIQLPALADYEAGVSSIPSIVNQTLAQLMHTDPSSQGAVVNTLHIVAANIRTNLIRNNLYTAEVEREFEVLWNLLEVAADPNPLNQLFNTTSQSPDYTHDMKQYLTIIHWYLMQLEEATDNSSISQLLHPYLSIVQMNVAQQLAQTELTIFISDKIKHLMRYLQHPLGDEDVDEIGKTAFAIIGRLFQFVKDGVRTQEELQQTDFGESLLNSSAQIEQILHTIQQWWRNPNVTTTLAEMLQWGNSTDTATPLRDLNHLLKTLDVLLTDDQRVLLHTVRNIIKNLNQAIMMVEKHGDEGMEQALPPIMAALQHALHFLSAFVELPQLPPQHDILNTVQLSLKLVLQPNMSLPESVNTCIYILSKGEELVEDTVPEPFAVYLKVPLTLGKMYFKAKNNGPETMNQLILDQMMAVRSLLPANSTAQAVVSGLISVVHLVLEKGNQCTWKDLTAGNMTVIVEHIHDFMERLWPHLGLDAPLPSLLSDFAEIIPIVERLLKGEADQETWEDLEDILEIVLSPLQETEHWHNVSFFVHQLGKVAESEVKNMQAENDMIRGLQMSVVMLITEVAHSLNSTHLVLSDFSRKMWTAMEQTLKAAEQANGTLTCSQVVALWEPVGGALGLNDSVVATWCQTHLKKVLEAYAEADKVYSGLGMQNMDGKPMASTILEVVRSLYHVSVNQSALNEQFIAAISSELAALTGEPLSPSAQQHLREQLQKMLQQDSLLAMDRIFHKLVSISPALQPHLEAAQKALSHILKNSQLMQNVSLPKDLLKEAAMIFLSSANITVEDVMLLWDKFPGNHTDSYVRMLGTVVKLLTDLGLFEDSPMGPQRLEMFLASTTTRRILRSVLEMVSWLMTSEDCGLDLLMHAVPKTFDIVKQVLSALREMGADVPCVDMYEPLVGNTIAMLKQFVKTSDLLDQMEQRAHVRPASEGKDVQTVRPALQQKPPRYLMDDIIDLFYLDYPTLFHALSVLPTSGEMIETLHAFFANPDLVIVVNGVFKDLSWDMGPPQETTINASLGVISYLTCSDLTEVSILHPLLEALEMVPDEFPFACFLKRLASILAAEAHEIQGIMKSILEFLELDVCDPRSKETWDRMTSQVCKLETSESMQDLMWSYSLEPGLLCEAVLPLLQILIEVRNVNTSELNEVLFEALIGDPATYKVQTNWTSAIGKSLGFSNASLFGINATSPSAISVGELMINASAFVEDLNDYVYINPAALHVLMTTKLPRHNLQILSWLVDLRHCRTGEDLEMEADDRVLFEALCSMRTDEWYSLTLLMARHMSLERFVFRMVLSEDMQNMVGVMLQVVDMLITMMEQIMPSVNELQSYMSSMKDLNLASNPQFSQKSRRERRDISPQATFVTISRALCSHGILALFGASKLPTSSNSQAFMSSQQREELIDRFKIPRDATPYCTNMYLDMVNTTGGAIAWAFLKPMLMGEILYTPDTPVTRSIMRKSNNTLHEFANLRKYSEQWIESSSYILKSAKLLSQTLPLLQNSLGNTFVKNFIEMQTDVDVGRMKETLKSFSNLTKLLEENKQMVSQVTTLSTLMVNISSCITFDRYRGYDSEDQLNTVAQELATDRQLFGSVIFKLPENGVSSSSTLPPEVRYTIRMHMDNVMRTDRARRPFYSKERHLSSKASYRYNRGFVYLQENIERAIIETQTGHRVTDPAVQIQPFPYPCHYRDEYLEAMSFVFPLMLMIAWILFVADFVRKLVYEKELRLHEYMKMMGVNPLSHFFAWFLECAAYLVFTIVILTLLLKYSGILGHSDGFVIFLFLCDYGLSILAFSYLVSSFFDRNYIAGLSGSLLYVLCFFPYIVVMAVETNLTFSQKSILSIFSPTCFSYASQYLTRFEAQGEGIQWSNSYISPIAGDVSSFGWLCWLMVIDSMLYFLIGAYIRVVFPGVYGIPAPWYFPIQRSFWAGLFCSSSSHSKGGRLFGNIMQQNQPVLPDAKGKGQSSLSTQEGGDFSHLPVGVSLHGLTKSYGDRLALENLNLAFYEGHVTSLLGHNGAGKTTTMSLLTGLFAPSAGSIQVYGKDMQSNLDEVRTDLGVCMQYDVLFDHMTTKEHLLLYGQIKAPHWTKKELHEQVRTILEETGMYAHRHKRVGTLSGGMKRKLSISIAFIGGSRLVVLDEPTTGVDPCSRRSIWEIVIQHKKNRTIIMSSHHLDEAEILSDRIAFLERGGLKCCGTPYYLKDKLGRGYKLTLTKKVQSLESDSAEIKTFIQAHIPEAHLLECQGRDLVYSLPPFTSSNSSSYRSLLTALDANLDALHLGGYGISDTTLEEVFLQLTEGATDLSSENPSLSISESVSDAGSIDGLPEELSGNFASHTAKLTGPSTNTGLYLAWQQISAMMIKRFHHTRRDIKGLLTQILLPVLFVVFAMGLGSIRSDLRHYPEMELSPALYNIGPSYTFFRNHDPNTTGLLDSMLSFPGIDNECLAKAGDPSCTRTSSKWKSSENGAKATYGECKCARQEQVCEKDNFVPPHTTLPSSQIAYNVTGFDVEKYLVGTTNDFIRNRYGGFDFGMQLPPDLQMDLRAVPKNRTLSKVWFNPEGHHTMPAYLNSLNNFILRANLPADKDPKEYGISVSSHPYFGRPDDEDAIVQGMLQILVVMCVLTGYSLTTASFAIYEVDEHHNGAKRLQHIAGVSEPLYWAVNFLYDMMTYMIPVTLTVAVIAAFQIPAFVDRQNLAAIFLLLVLFGFATFPWMYLLSGLFKGSEMAFITYVCINLFITVNTIMSTSIVHFMGQLSIKNSEAILEIFTKLCNAFLIFPQFSFGNGLMHLARMNIEVQILSGYGVDAYQSPFSSSTFRWMFVSLFIQGLVFFALRLLFNKSLIRKVRRLVMRKKAQTSAAHEEEDEDVTAERTRVASGAADSDILQVNQLSKVYQHINKKKVHAVKRLSVGIPAGECFGLLGENGAGKTTTFKMLTGDVSPTDGTAQIKDQDGRLVDIMECRNRGINIGYCPQVDALDSLLTGEEHLYFYARIRGIAKMNIAGVVNYLLKRLGLNYHRNIITDGYSCGTRRKLSTAMALVGHPQILLLDEPSSGMDPRTKRHLWKIISEEVRGKSAVVLTSHSMEECEALCSRLAIMVKGQFRCLGSLQHIKNRFGSGFTVKMYLAEAAGDVEAITGFMQRRFPSTYLKDQHSSMVEFHVPVAPGGVADIFDQLESNKNGLRIKNFSVSQTTLDEVFINFATGNIDMDAIDDDDNESDVGDAKSV